MSCRTKGCNFYVAFQISSGALVHAVNSSSEAQGSRLVCTPKCFANHDHFMFTFTCRFYDILMIISNHLKNVVIISSSLEYIQQNIEANKLGPISSTTIKECKETIVKYKKSIRKLQEATKYVPSKSRTPNTSNSK